MTFWHTLEALKGLNSSGRAGRYGESALEDGGRTLVRVNPDQRILKATHKSCGRAVELEALYCSSAASCIKGQHQQPGGSQGGPGPPLKKSVLFRSVVLNRVPGPPRIEMYLTASFIL